MWRVYTYDNGKLVDVMEFRSRKEAELYAGYQRDMGYTDVEVSR